MRRLRGGDRVPRRRRASLLRQPDLREGALLHRRAGRGPIRQEYDFTSFAEVVASAEDAYKQAGVTDPRNEISMAEVHDCFTPTELVLMEDLGFSPAAKAGRTSWRAASMLKARSR